MTLIDADGIAKQWVLMNGVGWRFKSEGILQLATGFMALLGCFESILHACVYQKNI